MAFKQVPRCRNIGSTVVYCYNGGLLPDIIPLTQGYYHQGNRLNTCRGFVLSLQPMKQYIISTMFDDVLHCFSFVFAFCLVPLRDD